MVGSAYRSRFYRRTKMVADISVIQTGEMDNSCNDVYHDTVDIEQDNSNTVAVDLVDETDNFPF